MEPTTILIIGALLTSMLIWATVFSRKNSRLRKEYADAKNQYARIIEAVQTGETLLQMFLTSNNHRDPVELIETYFQLACSWSRGLINEINAIAPLLVIHKMEHEQLILTRVVNTLKTLEKGPSRKDRTPLLASPTIDTIYLGDDTGYLPSNVRMWLSRKDSLSKGTSEEQALYRAIQHQAFLFMESKVRDLRSLSEYIFYMNTHLT